MFGIVLRKNHRSHRNFAVIMKFVVVGDSSTGKSSLLVQLTDKRFLGQSDPTIGVEFGASLISLPNGKKIKAQVWDTAGQESFRAITRSYYRGAAGALLVFDTTHRRSFLNLDQWLEDLKLYGDPGLTIVVVGNKADLCESKPASPLSNLSNRLSSSREVSTEEARLWAEQRGLEYVETSAKTGDNVEEAFAAVARKMHEAGLLDQQSSNKKQVGVVRVE
ncbi:P-loop containing nucleoside triphosphate hydrolase protein [Phakopsora pachyrhizi]|nr:P-loop containing nucleoside triphosphate hydrolase protein [Phakopsora pachyrhizi]